MKRLYAILLALTLLVSLAACGAPAAVESDAPEAPSAAPTELEGEWRLIVTETPLPEGLKLATSRCEAGGLTYYGGVGETGPALVSVAADGAERPVALPEDCQFVHALCETPEGITALCGSYPIRYIDASGEGVENESPEGRLFLLPLGADGEAGEAVPLAQTYPEPIFRQLMYRDGDYILLSQPCLVLVGPDGAEKGRLEPATTFTGMREIDGEVIVVDSNSGGSAIFALDSAGFSLTKKCDLADCLIAGVGTDAEGKLLLNDLFSCTVLRPDLATGETETVLSWLDDLNDSELTGSDWVEALADGGWRFFSRYDGAVYGAELKFFEGARKELVIATDGGYFLSQLAMDFNARSEDYKVEVVTYGQYDASGQQERPFDLLRTELMTGEGPDMFAFNWTDTMADTEGSGIYEDLIPWLENDPDYSAESFVPGLYDALSAGGAMYWLPFDFWITTFMAPVSLVGERTSITMDELDSIVSSLGGGRHAFESWRTRNDMLGWVSRFALPAYVDEEAGVCCFENPEFIALLEKCAEQPPEPETSSIADVGLPDDGLNVLRIEMLQSVDRLAGIKSYRGDDYCFCGFPTESGGESLFTLSLRLGMSSASENKEGCWEFLRYCLSPEAQNEGFGGLPSNSAVLEAQLDAAVREERISAADVEKLRALLAGTTMLEGTNRTLLDIISEEAAAYFAGGRTAEDCAARIQSKASIYLSEKS